MTDSPITDFTQKSLPKNIQDMLDGKHWKQPFKEAVLQDASSLAAAKQRLQELMYIEGQITGADLYNMAADEIARLRAQVEELTADAIVRADKQARLIQAMWNIQQISIHPEYREVAAKVLKEIGELK